MAGGNIASARSTVAIRAPDVGKIPRAKHSTGGMFANVVEERRRAGVILQRSPTKLPAARLTGQKNPVTLSVSFPSPQQPDNVPLAEVRGRPLGRAVGFDKPVSRNRCGRTQNP